MTPKKTLHVIYFVNHRSIRVYFHPISENTLKIPTNPSHNNFKVFLADILGIAKEPLRYITSEDTFKSTLSKFLVKYFPIINTLEVSIFKNKSLLVKRKYDL